MEVEDLREAEPSRAQSSPAHFHIFGLLLPSTSPIYRFSPRLSSPTIYFVIPIYLPELPFSISFPCFGHLVMAANSPVQDPPTDASAKQSAPSPSPALVTPPLKIETPPSDSGQTPSAVPAPTPRPDDLPQPTSPDPIHLPSYSRWFSWNGIHECEVRFLPEFFDSRSPSKNPRVYKYLRNSIVKNFRECPSKKITFTDIRKTLVADVGSIRRVFDFLEAWGLINYSPSALSKPLKWEDRDSKSNASASNTGEPGGGSANSSAPKDASKRVCSGCKSICSIACFACDKFDLTLCARCYVRGNYRVGVVSSSDFRRVEINDDTRTDWTDKETLHLLEALTHYGDDWKKVAQHVGGRTERECVAHFVKLPLGEQFHGYPDSEHIDNNYTVVKDHASANLTLESTGASIPNKRIRLSPLADASNPIMAQAAFLSSLVGIEVAEAAAQAAVIKLSEMDFGRDGEIARPIARNTEEQGNDVASCEGSLLRGSSMDMEKAISHIVDVQMKEFVDKLNGFEEGELQMEKGVFLLSKTRAI
ncbi:SWI/SNF complex subunit SWI3B [Cucumis melo var. makuwa]|uniref:SWI/SNF complex subunit SWI3B n=1 Tax=Cucumis melo var. makuwa TaxID=1194695 RepID=A0A5D3D8W2_CUCMM|nr:SWI/SNF complex subunit SWI3B [Cucumis melo var. makuwa]TYK19919.1 SWI/SNF complex subunit SWI3B [Cucumis melo var. makuwa]